MHQNNALYVHSAKLETAQRWELFTSWSAKGNASNIGETGRPLSARISEQLAGKRRGNVGSPLGKHKIEAHCGEDFEVKCRVLGHETEIAARKVLEAAWIYTKHPTMNAKNECVSIASNLLSLLSLCKR